MLLCLGLWAEEPEELYHQNPVVVAGGGWISVEVKEAS